MNFYTYGNIENPVIVLIHGGGFSHKMFEGVTKLLQNNYYVVLPLLDGHNEECNINYKSSKEEAHKISNYIKENHNGEVFLLGGASLGAQISLEILSNESIKVEYSILESGVYFKKTITKMLVCNSFMLSLTMKMLKSKFISKQLFKMYDLSDNLLEDFIKDTRSLSYESSLNLYKTYFSYIPLKSLKNCSTNVIVVYGSKEKRMIKKDRKGILKYFKNSSLKEMKGYNHCELSISFSDRYVEVINELVKKI